MHARRGALIRIFTGEPRATLTAKAGKGYYHVLVVEPYKQGVAVLYKDLLTREGIALCMERLAAEGVLCVHISNRFYDLEPVIADAAQSLGLACLHGYDFPPWEKAMGYQHFSSEWMMLARRRSDLAHLKTPEGYAEAVEKAKNEGRYHWKEQEFWGIPMAYGKHLWTDGGENSYRGLYRSDPGVAEVRKVVDNLQQLLMGFLPYNTVHPVVQPLYTAVNALDRIVVEGKNRPGQPGAN